MPRSDRRDGRPSRCRATGAPEQHQHGQGDAGAVRQIALEISRIRRWAARRSISRIGAATRARAAQTLAQQHGRADSGRFQVSWAPAISAIERGVLHHPLHGLIECYVRKSLASSGADDVSAMPGLSAGPQGRRGSSPRCGRRSGNPQQLTPGSQAPHAPPALTFGLPGKQRVNSVPAGHVLTWLMSSLPDVS